MNVNIKTSLLIFLTTVAAILSGCGTLSIDTDIETGKAIPINSGAASSNPRVQKAIDYMAHNDISKMPLGKIDIDENISLNITETELKNVGAAKLEAHKKYIDLQFVIKGEEIFGLKKSAECSYPQNPYNAEKDYTLFFDSFDTFENVKAGEFILLPPEWGHAPAIGNGKIRKGVFKIKIK